MSEVNQVICNLSLIGETGSVTTDLCNNYGLPKCIALCFHQLQVIKFIVAIKGAHIFLLFYTFRDINVQKYIGYN